METPQILSTLAGAIIAIGLTGALIRRSWLVALAGLELMFVGVAVLFFVHGAAREDAAGVARGILILLFGVAFAIVGTAVAIAVFRRRATVNLDELRELSG